MYGCLCVVQIIVWQIIYFDIICLYLKLKLKSINQTINSYNLNQINIIKLMKSLNSIHNEINDYNNNYWSQFLFWFCITFTQIYALTAYQVISGNIPKIQYYNTDCLYLFNIIMHFLHISSSGFCILCCY
jgi:hypothetical protein